MNDGVPAWRLTEPRPIDCHLIEGAAVEVRDDFIRLVGWIHLETVTEAGAERRIVVRVAMPTAVTRTLIRDLRRAVARGGH